MYAQLASNWCWLACAQMVGDTPPRKLALKQCTLAEQYIAGAANCCVIASPTCNQGGSSSSISTLYTSNGISNKPISGGISEAALRQSLNSGRLVQVGWRATRMGHVALVIRTYTNASGSTGYVINDPWPPRVGSVRYLSYADIQAPPLTSANGTAWTWVYTWEDLA